MACFLYTASLMRIPLIAANWKMHGRQALLGAYVAGVTSGLKRVDSVECVVCPPAPYLAAFAAFLRQNQVEGAVLGLGAQDCSPEQGDGAYTGEVGAAMLADVGCNWVIVGHSERRARQGEDDELVARKFEAALAARLSPILCVGESASQRRSGDAEEVVSRQLVAVMDRVGAERMAQGAVAYEPIWAIGSGQPATPQSAQDMHAMMRRCIAERSETAAEAARVLYGGSVKPDNAGDFFAQPDIDGALVGGASLDPASFCAIAAAAAA